MRRAKPASIRVSDPNERTSRFLAFVLRHEPEAIGLHLDREGWASVEELIACAAAHHHALSPPYITQVVSTNDKQRFALSPDGARIRAVQGYSREVDLGLAPAVPPAVLFHGTSTRFADAIRRAGLKPGNRQHVHLSENRIWLTRTVPVEFVEFPAEVATT